MQIWIKVAALALALSWASPAAALTTYLVGQKDGGYGQHGLYLGDTGWNGKNSSYLNWDFVDVTLSIGDNGDAVVQGTMARHYDKRAYPSLDLAWTIHITLQDAVVVGNVSSVGDMMSNRADGDGMEWQALSMTIGKPDNLPYSTSVVETGWIGYAMPSQGHDNPAEAHWKNGELTFDAWYKNPTSRARWYKVGDSKTDAPIPEPSAAAAFMIGSLLVLFAIRTGQKQH